MQKRQQIVNQIRKSFVEEDERGDVVRIWSIQYNYEPVNP